MGATQIGDGADVAALVDRIKEAPAEEAVETFLALRWTVTAAADLPGKLADVGRTTVEAAGVFALAPYQGGVDDVRPSVGHPVLLIRCKACGCMLVFDAAAVGANQKVSS